MGGARVTCQHPPPFYKLTPTLLWALPGALDINSGYPTENTGKLDCGARFSGETRRGDDASDPIIFVPVRC